MSVFEDIKEATKGKAFGFDQGDAFKPELKKND